MENVSKALIIAGAILLAILLITLGISIFNSQKGIDDKAAVVGELIELKASDTADIIEGYSVNRYADEIVDKSSKGYYNDYYTGIKIDGNATYIISFDYIIEEKEPGININCGIGMGIDNPNSYNSDFIYQVPYPNQNIGEKSTFTFTLKPEDEKRNYKNYHTYKHKDLYLSLRLARTYPASKFKVKIENIKIKYK